MSIRVLLADPEEMLLECYRRFLSQCSFEVKTASDGPDCLAKLREWKPDVLVLEPDMPNGWGDKVLDQLARDPDPNRASVLILTRRDQATFAAPVCEYHVKPFPMAELCKSIRAAVNFRSKSART